MNARDAMPVGGTIKIAKETSTVTKNMQSIIRRLCLGPLSCSFSDTGHGIDKHIVAEDLRTFLHN